MSKGLNLVKLYPDLFEGLDAETIDGITETYASAWHEGWEPNREDVADLIAWEKDEIDDAEYDRRNLARAHERGRLSAERARAAANLR